MQQFLQITFSGIATGAIYAIAAVGFSLLWQTAGAINFAHGDFIMLPAIIMLVLGLQQPTLGIPEFVPIIGGANVSHPIPGSASSPASRSRSPSPSSCSGGSSRSPSSTGC